MQYTEKRLQSTITIQQIVQEQVEQFTETNGLQVKLQWQQQFFQIQQQEHQT